MLVPLTLGDVMNDAVESVDCETPARSAIETLDSEGIGSVVVLDDDDIVGILTESDVVRLVASDRALDELAVADICSTPAVTVDADAAVTTAAETMREEGIKKLPVVGDADLVGIVTTTDLSNYLPHLVHTLTGRETVGETAERHNIRPDTAYELDDWTFEYVGHEAEIDVGDVLKFTTTLDEEDVADFAEASGDTNRLHLDEEYARGTRFGARIAHGTLVAGTISAALARLPGLVIYLSQEVSYMGPVELGEEVTARCEVVENIGSGRFRLATSVETDAGETVIDGEAVVIADDLPETA